MRTLQVLRVRRVVFLQGLTDEKFRASRLTIGKLGVELRYGNLHLEAGDVGLDPPALNPP